MKQTTGASIKFLHQLLTLLALLLIPLFVYWRLELVDAKIGRKFGLPDTFDLAVIHADSFMLAAVFALLLLSWQSVRRGWHLVPRLLVLLFLFAYLADLVILKQFGTRILFSSVQLYIQYTALVWEQTQEFLGGFWPAIASMSAAFSFAVVVIYPPAPPWAATRGLCAGLLLAALVTALMPWKLNYVKSWIVENYLSANLFVPEARLYSDSKSHDFLSAPTRPLHCEPGLAQRQNVIILIVESLSSYQSSLFGGIRDWTPELDALGAEAVIYPRMHANGFSTNEGLVGILGGVRLFSPFAHMLFRAVMPFQTAWGLKSSLPREFIKAGYHTAFLTTGPLQFAGIGDWLKEIGFAEIEGAEQSFYQDWRKVQFGAASDEALYARSLNWIATRTADQPWMLTLATVSTHQPFRHPDTLELGMEQVFRYADKQAAGFILALQDSGYFDNGIMLVLGDHRSMTPVLPAEENAFGSAATSRVPLFLFGFGDASVHQGNFQQSDLLPSFRYWLGDEYCHDDRPANLFDTDSIGRCAFHLRGAKQSLVEVLCPDGRGQVELDGDNTRFISATNINGPEQERILGIIARQRLAGHRRHLELLSTRQKETTMTARNADTSGL